MTMSDKEIRKAIREVKKTVRDILGGDDVDEDVEDLAGAIWALAMIVDQMHKDSYE